MKTRILIRLLLVGLLVFSSAFIPLLHPFLAQESDRPPENGNGEKEKDKAEAPLKIDPEALGLGQREKRGDALKLTEEDLRKARIEVRETFYPSGEIEKRFYVRVFPDGREVQDGIMYIWNENGTKFSEIECVLGKDTGMSMFWYENGMRERRQERNSKGDIVGRLMKWHPNGFPALEAWYDADGVRIDTWTYWHDNGRIKSTGKYDGDCREGIWREWDHEGKLLSEKTYKNGDVVEEER